MGTFSFYFGLIGLCLFVSFGMLKSSNGYGTKSEKIRDGERDTGYGLFLFFIFMVVIIGLLKSIS
ncbi:MAG: hypothetical protein CBC42_01460 [Betaproteobacteria bacterium TMED82]|nr:MAG: hypothetical protein CBC42_01460 [Betaproteobacteria bacterium TMED82]|tara:strand:+ start:27339 stop:27533 length:195 start_codon:yes stop_codon:yes gene_type:complete